MAPRRAPLVTRSSNTKTEQTNVTSDETKDKSPDGLGKSTNQGKKRGRKSVTDKENNDDVKSSEPAAKRAKRVSSGKTNDKKDDESTLAESTPGKAKNQASTKNSNKDADALPDVSSVHLDNEESQTVLIFLPCNDVRTQINRALGHTSVTQASLSRAISAASGVDVTARQLKAFLTKKGRQGGADSPAFYAAYVFFEKERILKGRKKGKIREDMENVWGKDGMKREKRNQFYTCCGSERPTHDRYGMLHFVETGKSARGGFRRKREKP